MSVLEQNQETKTVVRGIRAPKELWEKCDRVAKRNGITRNFLIVKIMEKLCEGSK